MQDQAQKSGRPIEWAPKMRTRGGKIGNYLGRCAVTGKRRLLTSNRFVEYTDDKDLYTTWLLDDFGFARGDAQPCAEDAVGAA